MSWSGWPKLPIFSGHHCKWNVWKLRNQGFGKKEKAGKYLGVKRELSEIHDAPGCWVSFRLCFYVLLSKISFCVGIHFRMFNIQFNVKHFCIFCFQKSVIDFGCVLHSVYSTVCNMKGCFLSPCYDSESLWVWNPTSRSDPNEPGFLVCLLFFVI